MENDKPCPAKILVDKQLLWKQPKNKPSWKDIKHIEFEDDDTISCEWVEPYVSENESWDGHWHIEIIRKVIETDEQYNKRIDNLAQQAKWAKERRYESFLRLKKEFEPEGTEQTK